MSIFAIVPITANAEEYTCGDYKYVLLPDGTAEITLYLNKYGSDTDISIPSTLDGYTVTKIGESAFKGACIQSVVIPNTITSIGYSAFFQCSLKSVEIPDSVKGIGTFAFDYCPLKSVVIPDSVEYMGECVFSNCSSLTSVKLSNSLTSIPNNTFYFCDELVSIDIPDSVTYIDESAFEFCSKLESINFSSSLTTIGYKAFKDCDQLNSIKLPKSLDNIASNAFEGCGKLENIEFSDSLTSIGSYAFSWCRLLKSVKLPDSLTIIWDHAFKGCSELENIELPDSLIAIKAYAFEDCDQFKDIEIPASVTNVGGGVFNGCDNLVSITVNKGNTVYDNRNNCNAIIHTETNELVVGISSTIIPDSVESIGDGAFSGCTFSSIEIPDSVHTIGANAFANCYNLTSIKLPDAVTEISYKVFEGCTNLKTIKLPNSLKCIGEYAFSCCRSLDSIVIPDSVTTIGRRAFEECNSLSSVKLSDSLTNIDIGMFYNCSSLSSINIPPMLKNIGNSAFYKCKSLECVNIPDSIIYIDNYAFNYCYNLTISLPNRDCFSNSAFFQVNKLIFRESLNDTNIKIIMNESYVYDGNKKTPKVEVYYKGSLLNENYQYKLEYSNNINASNDATIKIVGLGIYDDLEKTIKFTILPKDVSNSLDVEVKSFGCKQEECVMSVTTSEGISLEEGIDYDKVITYSKTDNEALIYILCKGNYTGCYRKYNAIETLTYSGVSLKYNLLSGTSLGTHYGPVYLNFELNTPYDKITLNSSVIYINGEKTNLSIGSGISLKSGIYEIDTFVSFNYYIKHYSGSYIGPNGNVIYTGPVWYEDKGVVSKRHSATLVVKECTTEIIQQPPVSVGTDTIYLGLSLSNLYLGDKSINVQWSSSDESVATVEDGVVTMHKLGDATITAKTELGDVTWSLDGIQALDIAKNTSVLNYDPHTKTADVYWKGELLDEGEDYTVNTKDVDGITEVTITGKNLFTGKITTRYYQGTAERFFGNILGDVDGDDKVTIIDATYIQRHIAQLTTIPEDRLTCADTDRDTITSIIDATMIQRFIAQLITEL